MNRTPPVLRLGLLVLGASAVGAGVLLLVLVAWPAAYLDIADRFRWRLGVHGVAQDRLESSLSTVHLRGDAAVGPGATLLFGDSHLHGLPTSALAVPATNYAVAGEPASRLALRIGRYGSLLRAQRVIVLSGTNDLQAGLGPDAAAAALARVLGHIPHGTPVLLVEEPPTRMNAGRLAIGRDFNLALARVCSQRSSCRLLTLAQLADPQGQLHQDYASDDGIHLSSAGYRVFAQVLNEALLHDQTKLEQR